MTIQQIKVVIVDDHPGVRAGIRKLLYQAKDIVIVGEGGDGAEAIRLATTKNPDVMLLDVELPVLRGEEVARQLKDNHSHVKILAVSSYNDRQYILAMLENGAVGYITKDEAPDLLLEAVYSIFNGKRKWISPRASQHASQDLPDEQSLTDREMDILNQLAMKKTEKEISQSLNIDERRLSRHLQLLKAKFGVDSLEDLRRSFRNYIGAHNVDQHNSH
jgi:DNA-binding NarL/FixJ family response regulator